MKKKDTVLTLLKYLYFIITLSLGAYAQRNGTLFLEGFFELCTIFLLSNLLFDVNKIVARAVNSLLLLFYGIEITVLKLGGSYVTPIMLTNVDSLSALSGKTLIYLSYVLVFFIVLLLPLEKVEYPFCIVNTKKAAAAAVCFNLVIVSNIGSSPLISAVSLGKTLNQMRKMSKERNQLIQNDDLNEQRLEFSREEVGNYRTSEFEELPNVLLIFTEGLSQHIIDDSRGIMPNVKQYQQQALNFVNYYNHTAATYRGLIGQLYSSHQYDNTDTNSFISLQEIMSNYGYQTTFINPEPNNEEFTDYLNSMGFDQVISSDCEDWMSDRETYDLIFDTLAERTDKPQLISVYSFGTHVSLDRSEYLFGDGSDHVLNRFHNVDYYFGRLMEKIENAPNLNNTLVIFTTDHATYVDEDYLKAFSETYSRVDGFCDEIPLFFYYSGMTPEVVNVEGRNSVNLTPSILDYLDMDGENYFLGNSLFAEATDNVSMETVYSIPNQGWYITTYGDVIAGLTEAEREVFMAQITDYTKCAVSQ